VELSGISLDACGFFSAKSFFDIGEEQFSKKYQGTKINRTSNKGRRKKKKSRERI
jgi:hypothetical protein